MAKIKLKHIGFLAALGVTGFALTTCSSKKTSDPFHGVEFGTVLEDNSDDTCFDEHMANETISILDGNQVCDFPMLNAIDKLEEQLAIYGLLSEIKSSPKLEQETELQETEMIEYTVKTGDSLTSIAEEYHTDVEAICEMNGLTSANIVSGQRLRLQALEDTLSLDELEKLMEKFSDQETNAEERIDIMKKLYHEKAKCSRWLTANAEVILEKSCMATLKCAPLDVLGLTDKSYSKVTINDASGSRRSYDIKVSDYDVNSEGQFITTYLNLDGSLRDVQQDIYALQGTSATDELTDGKVEDYMKVISTLKTVVSSDFEIHDGLFGKVLRKAKE